MKNKSTVRLLLAYASLLLVLFATYYTFQHTANSLTNKISETEATVGELNSELQTIRFAEIQVGTSFAADSYTNKFNALKDKTTTFTQYQPNTIEQLLHEQKATELNATTDKATVIAQQLNNSIESLDSKYQLLIKLLQYNPAEDFIFLGQNPSDDEGRINATKQGINQLLEHEALLNDKVVKNEIIAIQNALAVFETDRNLANFVEKTTASQRAIVTHLDSELKTTVQEFTNQYNELLYAE